MVSIKVSVNPSEINAFCDRLERRLKEKHMLTDFAVGWANTEYKNPNRNFKVNENDFKKFNSHIVRDISSIKVYSFSKLFKMNKNSIGMADIIIILKNNFRFDFKAEFRKNVLDRNLQQAVLGNGVRNGIFWRKLIVSALRKMIKQNNFPRNSIGWKIKKGRENEANPEMKDTLQHYYSIAIFEGD